MEVIEANIKAIDTAGTGCVATGSSVHMLITLTDRLIKENTRMYRSYLGQSIQVYV